MHGSEDRTQRAEAKQRIACADQPMKTGLASGHHTCKRSDDAGQLEVSLCLAQPERGLTVLELDSF
jgi:hypothetical protein